MQKFASFFRLTILLALITGLLACTTQSKKMARSDAWPEHMPSRTYFIKVYEADAVNKEIQKREEYLTWILRFYNGWELYGRGWTK
jgi:hypothetical protein